jgi:hypothetical protein
LTHRERHLEEEIMPGVSHTEVRELDRRTSDGIDVQLLWNPRTDRVSIAVEDGRSGEQFEVAVAASEALTAFHHPYAYAARRTLRSHYRRPHHYTQL